MNAPRITGAARAVALAFVLGTTAVLPACRDPREAGHDAHEHEHEHEHEREQHAEGEAHDAHGEEAPRFGPRDMQRFGVAIAEAGPGIVDFGIELPGEIRPNGDRLAHLAPRFPGTVREVRKRLGDAVKAGDVLAVVESETLSRFELRAAFDGVVIDRHVTEGEIVRPDAPAFIVGDLSTVWVDVAVYQKDLAHVDVGRPVRIDAGPEAGSAEGVVASVSPMLDQATRTAVARIVLPNPGGRWRPGTFVTAVVLDPLSAPVVVPRSALHSSAGRTVVYVAERDRFDERPVVTGRLGRTTAEIVGGLAAGTRIATDGSFLVKADLAKSAAGHAH